MLLGRPANLDATSGYRLTRIHSKTLRGSNNLVQSLAVLEGFRKPGKSGLRPGLILPSAMSGPRPPVTHVAN